jgi:ADP-heptose:LPS heptosyltransferase
MTLSQKIYVLKRFFINTCCLLFDLVFFSRQKTSNPNVSNKKLVLVIRLDAIGDFIIWTDAARALPTLFPKETHHLILVGNPAWKDLAKDLQVFEEIIPVDRMKLMLNWKYRYQVFSALSLRIFDVVLYPSYDQEFGSGCLLVRLLNARQKVGIKSGTAIDISFWIKKAEQWFSVLHQPKVSNPHELIKNAAFIKELGNIAFEAALPTISMNEKIELLDFKQDNKWNEAYYVVFPGSRIGLRQWSTEKFASVCDEIYIQKGLTGIIVGTKKEELLAENLISQSKAQLISLTGKTNIKQLVQLIAGARFLIGNESAGVHIAVAVQTPSYCILGGGHFGRFMPYPTFLNTDKTFLPTPIYNIMPCFHCDWNCKYAVQRNKSVKCINDIPVEQVLKALNL